MTETTPILAPAASALTSPEVIGHGVPAEHWHGIVGQVPAMLRVPEGLGDLLSAGGPIMGILFAMSILALAIVLIKVWQLGALRLGGASEIEPALTEWRTGHPHAAIERLTAVTNPLAAIVAAAMAGCLQDADKPTVREEIERRALALVTSLRGHLRGLEVIASLSPLLGLLGTVIGMIDAFRALEASGNQVDPSVLSGGIWVALLTTAAGLGVAIPTLVALNGLERSLEGVTHRLEDQLTRVFTGHLRLDRAPVSVVPQGQPSGLADAS
jgi:biopolymer transport protein ExbB